MTDFHLSPCLLWRCHIPRAHHHHVAAAALRENPRLVSRTQSSTRSNKLSGLSENQSVERFAFRPRIDAYNNVIMSIIHNSHSTSLYEATYYLPQIIYTLWLTALAHTTMRSVNNDEQLSARYRSSNCSTEQLMQTRGLIKESNKCSYTRFEFFSLVECTLCLDRFRTDTPSALSIRQEPFSDFSSCLNSNSRS